MVVVPTPNSPISPQMVNATLTVPLIDPIPQTSRAYNTQKRRNEFNQFTTKPIPQSLAIASKHVLISPLYTILNEEN